MAELHDLLAAKLYCPTFDDFDLWIFVHTSRYWPRGEWFCAEQILNYIYNEENKMSWWWWRQRDTFIKNCSGKDNVRTWSELNLCNCRKFPWSNNRLFVNVNGLSRLLANVKVKSAKAIIFKRWLNDRILASVRNCNYKTTRDWNEKMSKN